MKREIILDTETTGMDPASGHRVVEIGCVELIGGVRTGKFFHSYLNPERDVPEEAKRIHGISTEFLKDKPLFAEVVEEFLTFVADSPLVIHNAAFDMKFVNAELERLGFAALEMVRALDTVMLARRKFPGAPASLDALCRRFNIDLSGREKHGALLDAELLAEVYLELLGGKQSMLALEQQESVSEQQQEISVPKTAFPIREFSPSAQELEAHSFMVSKLKKPLWT